MSQAPLVVYQDAIHGLRGAPSVELGPQPGALIATWLDDRLAKNDH